MWQHAARPDRPDLATYWDRWRTLDLDPSPLSWPELFVRYAAHHTGVHCCLVGTSSVDHLHRNVEAALRGPLPEAMARAVEAALTEGRAAWRGVV